MSAAGKRHLARIHELPCVVCQHCYGQVVPAEEAHHLEYTRGTHSDFATVPLCKMCHGGLHESRRRSFYAAHKLNDVRLLAWTIEALGRA